MLRAVLLMFCIAICAQAQTRTLALYVGQARGLDYDANLMMRAELQRLLAPARLEVVWKSSADHQTGDYFELVAVGSFEGSCSVAEPVLTSLSVVQTVASVGDTSVSDGHILPFFHIDCTRLVRLLGSGLDKSSFGRALARVIAHELYHIVAATVDHSETGVAKAKFSLHDLITPRFDFDASSVAQMKPVPVAAN